MLVNPPTIEDAARTAFRGEETPQEDSNLKTEETPSPTTEAKVEPEAQKETDVTEEESFTHIDPKTLSPENQAIYKSLLGDYTRKRQAESSEVKKLKAENERLRSQTANPSEQTAEAKPLSFKTVEEYNAYMEEKIKETAKQTYIEEQESAFDAQAQSDYPTLDERLDENNPVTYDPVLDDWLRSKLTDDLTSYVDERGTKLGYDYKSAVKRLVGDWDKYIDNLNKNFIKKQNEIVEKNSEKLRKSAPEVSKATGQKSSGPMSLDDAISEAASRGK